MRTTFTILLCVLTISVSAQTEKIDSAARLTQSYLKQIKPVYASWVRTTSTKAIKSKLSADAVRKMAATTWNRDLTSSDIETLVQLVMAQVAADADKDVRSILEEMEENNKQKKQVRDRLIKTSDSATSKKLKDKRDSLNELGEQKQLKLQMAMDRRNQFLNMVSALLKKASETNSSIISNLK